VACAGNAFVMQLFQEIMLNRSWLHTFRHLVWHSQQHPVWCCEPRQGILGSDQSTAQAAHAHRHAATQITMQSRLGSIAFEVSKLTAFPVLMAG